MDSIDAAPEVPQNNDSLVNRVRKWAPRVSIGISGVVWSTTWALSGKYVLENYPQIPDSAMFGSLIVAGAGAWITKVLLDRGIERSIAWYGSFSGPNSSYE